jgi:beta-N-acetylhexosaminidase
MHYGRTVRRLAVAALACSIFAAVAGCGVGGATNSANDAKGTNGTDSSNGAGAVANPSGSSTAATPPDSASSAPATSPLSRSRTPDPSPTLEIRAKAQKILDSMSLTERVGQTVMTPLNVATTSPQQIRSAIVDGKVGSVLFLGNWNGGTTALAKVSRTLQDYAAEGGGTGGRLLIATDQEGGQVQHLQGAGFSRMPSAVWQGTQTNAALRSQAKTWGGQLKSAGVNVNLAPVLGTVQTATRLQNAPIGALDRDFGKNAAGNAASGAAFIQGMSDAGIMTSVKHYPGLGAVTGNTDFTTNGILDATTVIGGDEESAFVRVLQGSSSSRPSIVMMSLATYSAIDAHNPAAFSRKLITNHLRGELGFDGVVTSDSLSAAAVSGIPANQLGVRFLEAGGDLVCVGAPGIAQQILSGMQSEARNSAAFRKYVDASALRVLVLKITAGLLKV